MTSDNIKRGASRLFILCFMAYSVSYIGRKGFATCLPEICNALAMSKTFGGAITTGYLTCYGAGQLISGIIGDRVSPKYMISLGLLGAGLANIAMGLCTQPYALLVFWCINGLFNSMMWSPIIKSLAEWVPKSSHSKMGTNIAVTIPAGTIVSYFVSWFCLKYFNWHITFFVCGSILIIASAVWYVGVGSLKQYISEIGLYKVQNEQTNDSFAQSDGNHHSVSLLKCIFATGLFLTFVGILFNGIIKDGVTDWVPTYITEFFKISPSTASLSSIILPVVNISGAFVAKFINTKITRNEMATSGILFAVCCFSIGGLYLFGKYNVVLAVLLIAISTASMLGVNNMFLTFIPLHFSAVGRSSSVTGLLNSFSYLAAAISSFTIGYIADNKGWNVTILFWLLAAVFGTAICIVGSFLWKNGKRKIRKL